MNYFIINLNYYNQNTTNYFFYSNIFLIYIIFSYFIKYHFFMKHFIDLSLHNYLIHKFNLIFEIIMILKAF